jgi:hypothetical protein
MKRIATHILTLVTGIALGVMIARSYVTNSSDFHWRKIAEYQKYSLDPSNYQWQGRFMVTKSDPPDIGPDLQALATLGEIERRDIIIPGLPNIRPHIERWATFAKDPAILYGSAPGRFQKGEIPLMFTLWFKPEANERVNQLVDEFTKMAQSNPGNAEPQAEQRADDKTPEAHQSPH